METNEIVRRIVSTDGHEIRITGVTSIDNTGSFDRFESDQGYIVVNRQNVLAYIIKYKEKQQ